MANTGLLLTGLARQMYEDIKYITQTNPTQVVDDDTAHMFNHLLSDIKQTYLSVPQVFAFKEMTPRTLKYKDALVMIGQLHALMAMVNEGVSFERQRPASTRPPTNPGIDPVPGAKAAGAGATGPRPSTAAMPKIRPQPPSEHDEELFGPAPPHKLNDDGTVPFTLELDEHGQAR